MAPVNYLVFEEASGDVRTHLDGTATFETAWVLRVLHQIAVGLNQLHAEGIAHQDMKPSNTLIFGDQSAKVADLGCADQAGSTSPRGQFQVAGDPKYAPPELLYSFVPSDWGARRQACDLYHLGSLILFMFTGVHTTAALMNYLLLDQQPGYWADPYSDVLPHLRAALHQVAQDLEEATTGLDAPALVTIFRELSDPDPGLRGDPKAKSGHQMPYSLQRYVSKLDLLARRAEIDWVQGPRQ